MLVSLGVDLSFGSGNEEDVFCSDDPRGAVFSPGSEPIQFGLQVWVKL